MTPLPKKKAIQDIVIFEDKKADKKIRKMNKEIKDLAEKQEEVSYSKELIDKWENLNPGKHAIWRGNYTKQFVAWAANVSPS